VLVGAAAAVAAGGVLGVRPPRASAAVTVVPRSEWGPELGTFGPLPDEPDVRFLLVHHTVNVNDYAAGDVARLLGDIHRFHTGPERGWPDIAYNFFVDRFGTVYEGRAGSLERAVAGDASGGSQGFAQLCAFLGDHRTVPPTEVALSAMGGLLAFLGDRHRIDLSPGATTTFTSRGSNRRPAGEVVTTTTISGHRDMSATACPGEAAYALVVDGTFARLATAARQPQPPATTTTTPPPPPTTTSTAPPETTTTTSAPAPSTSSTSVAPAGGGDDPSGGGSDLPVLPVAGVAAAAGLAAAIAVRRRRS
jgi:hypothetical protein